MKHEDGGKSLNRESPRMSANLLQSCPFMEAPCCLLLSSIRLPLHRPACVAGQVSASHPLTTFAIFAPFRGFRVPYPRHLACRQRPQPQNDTVAAVFSTLATTTGPTRLIGFPPALAVRFIVRRAWTMR